MPNFSTGIDVLAGLLKLIGNEAKDTAKLAENYVFNNSGEALLARLLGSASAIPAQQDLQNSIGEPTRATMDMQKKSPQQIQQFDEKSLNPIQKNALQTVKRLQAKQIEEAMTSGVTAQQVLTNPQIGIPPEAVQPMIGAPAGIPDQTQAGIESREGNQDLSQAMAGQQSPVGVQVTPQTGILGKLFGSSNISVNSDGTINLKEGGSIFDLNSGKAEKILKQIAGAQQVSGTEPIQPTTKYQEEMANKRTLLSNLMSGKITDAEKQQQAQQAFQGDLGNLVSAWDSLGAGKGPIGGRVGGLASIFGKGREARSRFDSLSTGLQYSVAGYITGQTGRALSDKDIERLGKLSQFSINMRGSDFKGKIQAILDFANSKISSDGGTPQFKTASDFMNSVKSNSGSSQQQSSSWTSDKEARYQELLKKRGGK